MARNICLKLSLLEFFPESLYHSLYRYEDVRQVMLAKGNVFLKNDCAVG